VLSARIVVSNLAPKGKIDIKKMIKNNIIAEFMNGFRNLKKIDP
jgi:hypothetical protein